MPKGRDLTIKQQKFVDLYLSNGGDSAKAYRETYSPTCSPKTAYTEGKRLCRHPLIAPLINQAKALGAKRIEKAMERYGVTVERVRTELAFLAFANMGDYVRIDGDGNVHFDASDLTPAQLAAISEITVEEFTDGKGEGARPVRRTKFKLHSKRDALVDLGKHLGMFGEEPGSGSGGETAAAQQLRAELRDMFAKAIEANQGMRALMQQAVAGAPVPAIAAAPAVIEVEPEPVALEPAEPAAPEIAAPRKTLADLKL